MVNWFLTVAQKQLNRQMAVFSAMVLEQLDTLHQRKEDAS